MTDQINDTLATAASAVTGNETPSNVMASRPTKESVWALYGGMLISAAIGAAIIASLTFATWPDTVAHMRVLMLGIMGILATICAPITVIALASSRLGRVEASAGENHLTLAGRA